MILPPNGARLPLLVCVGLVAAFVLYGLAVPLPWLLGPLLIMMIAGLCGVAPQVPAGVRYTGQLVIATAVAMNVTPAAVEVMATHLPLMVICACAAICFAICLALFLERFTSLDLPSALFTALPGGAMEMSTLAERYGGDASAVAFGQTVRLAAVVIIVPPIVIFSGVPFHDVVRELGPMRFGGPAIAVAIAVPFAIALHRMGVANAFFTGPVLSIGLATALGAPFGVMPGPVSAAAQVALGVTLGAMFKPLSRGASPVLITTLGIVVLLIAFGLSVALVLSSLSGETFAMLALANAPGSIAEMAIAAKTMSVDSALVTSYHLARIAFVVPFADLIFRLVRTLHSMMKRRGNLSQ